ncbi:MAG: Hpt domain-containing protein [Pseudomonadota bacterium]
MIEWKRVAELRVEIGSEDFDEVVPLFIEEVGGLVDTLRAGADLSRLEEDLHFLKGSALNLGFKAFSDLCSAGEKAAADGNADSVDIAAIIASFDSSQAMFEDGLARGLAA